MRAYAVRIVHYYYLCQQFGLFQGNVFFTVVKFFCKKQNFYSNMEDTQTWHIVKQTTGNCKVIPSSEVEEDNSDTVEKWGPFDSEGEAIARRVGLIRAGKCQPL
jgi:hypothetical protein